MRGKGEHYFWKMYFVYFLVMLLGLLTPVTLILWIGYRVAFPWEVPMPSWLRTLFILVVSGWMLSVVSTVVILAGPH